MTEREGERAAERDRNRGAWPETEKGRRRESEKAKAVEKEKEHRRRSLHRKNQAARIIQTAWRRYVLLKSLIVKEKTQ